MTPACIEKLLHDAIGLDPSSVGAAAIDRSVRLRMRRSGIQCMEEYCRRLLDSEEELQELIEDVVVPETWFFRHTESFDALARIVTQEGLPAHESDSGRLRVLSVPCATGEEPYSIVITLLEAGLPANRFTIDAMDVSLKALNSAKRAQYRPISFRSGDLGSREQYFERTETHYYVMERVRRQVRFRHGNLLAPDLLAGEEPYDLVFCRNVLIYFDRTTQERALQTLGRLLAPGGILVVGAAEAAIATSAGCMPVDGPASCAYRFRDAGREQQRPMSAPSQPADKTRALRRPAPPKPIAPIPAPQSRALEPAPPDSAPDLAAAARLADAGRLDEAAATCDACVRRDGLSAEAYYLLGLISDARGDADKAADCYRKALYLEPEHSETLLHLALNREKRGDLAGAKRLRQRARRNASCVA